MLNRNMATIDGNMKDMLFLMQDLVQLIYVCLDSKINRMSEKLTLAFDRITQTNK